MEEAESEGRLPGIAAGDLAKTDKFSTADVSPSIPNTPNTREETLKYPDAVLSYRLVIEL